MLRKVYAQYCKLLFNIHHRLAQKRLDKLARYYHNDQHLEQLRYRWRVQSKAAQYWWEKWTEAQNLECV